MTMSWYISNNDDWYSIETGVAGIDVLWNDTTYQWDDLVAKWNDTSQVAGTWQHSNNDDWYINNN